MSLRVLVVRNADCDPPGRLAEWLPAAGLDLDIVDGAALPCDLDGYAAMIVLGGPMSATDDAVVPWLAHERDLLRAAVSNEVPTLAICLGAQLLALAHGGRVAPNPDGPEFGAQLIAKRAATATDPLFGALPITPDVVQWHHDAVTVLPPGAILLASSPMCAHQAFRLGRLAWGVQFHFETDLEVLRGWAELDATSLEGYDLDLMMSRAAAVEADMVEVWQPFAQAFADIVRDPDAVRPPHGVRTATAEPVTDPAAIRAALAAELQASRTPPPTPSQLPHPRRRDD